MTDDATTPEEAAHACQPVTLWGNPVLRKRCTPVTVFDAEVQRLVDQLFETMYAIPTGVGLAANQIGRTERVFVVDCRDGLVAAVVNPTVTVLDADLQEGGEGCLSLPRMGLPTTRAMRCRVTGQDAKGNEIAYEGEGLRARAFQHETDHLNGRLYIDLHPTKVRKRLEDEMRAEEWFGLPHLDPLSEEYRRAQGEDEDEPVE